VVRTYGCYGTDRFFSGRRMIKDLTGSFKVPTLILDDGTIVDESRAIVEWAEANPASAG
jgi:glutathione S-transferase